MMQETDKFREIELMLSVFPVFEQSVLSRFRYFPRDRTHPHHAFTFIWRFHLSTAVNILHDLPS